jgi:hypothetical protein
MKFLQMLLETWTPTDILMSGSNNFGSDRLAMAAAAPELVRALLAVEWVRGTCTQCSGWRFERSGPSMFGLRGHDADCRVHVGLTKAGLETQGQRDAARKEIGL